MTATLICGAAGAGLALSSCGGGSSVGSVVDPVAQAAEISELAPGFKASFHEQITAPGSTTSYISGSEDFERDGQRGFITTDAHVEGKSLTISAESAGAELFLQVPHGRGSSTTHGKKWIEYNVDEVEAALGVNLSSLAGAGTSSSPSSELSYLRAAGGTVARVGSQQLQGMTTVHYRGSIDWERYPERVAPSKRVAARASVAALERLTGSSTQAFDVWIDRQHRVRREELTVHECLPGTALKAQMHFATELFDFGPQAIPKLPPSSEVADVTGYLAKQFKRVKLGCQ